MQEEKTRICSKCGIIKLLSPKYFYKDKQAKYGLHPSCKECNADYRKEAYPRNQARILAYSRAYSQTERGKRGHKNRYLKRSYGITLEEYESLREIQKDKCSICGRILTGSRPHLDHNKKNGIVRNILYGDCNTGLGMFGEDINILKQAIQYLVRWNGGI